MTKRAILLLTALLFIPTALAHGAEEPRSIETRLLADDDGGMASFAKPEGHDMLTLEVREAYYEGEPAIYFRYIFQAGEGPDMADDILDTLHFQAGGSDYSLSVAANYEEVFDHGFDAAFGPFDVFDGHPKAIDLVVKYSTMGVTVGGELTGIHMESANAGEVDEEMPGTYTYEGEQVPWLGDPTHTPSEDPAAYTVAGPATLLTMETAGNLTIQQGDELTLEATVTNPLADFEQFATVRLGFMEENVLLAPGESRTVELSAAPQMSGRVAIVASSDLGGLATEILNVTVEMPMDHGNRTDHMEDEHGDHMHDDMHDDMIVSVDLMTGDTFELVLDATGVFHYHNHHDKMVTGTINVLPADGEAVEHRIAYTADGFTPDVLTTHLGDTVVFENKATDMLIVMGTFDEEAEPLLAEPDDAEAPGAPLVAVLGAIGLLALIRRR